MNKYPAKPIADHLANHGRYGDNILVHMSRDEVAGIAALSPTGQLPTNPVTGQPEAFGMKDLFRYGLPIAASIAMPALLPGLPAALAGGIGSGLATTALTGDIERGLVSGVMGAGMGAASGAASKAATTAATEAAGQAATGGLNAGLTDMSTVLGNAGAHVGGAATEAEMAAILAQQAGPMASSSGMAGALGSAGTPEALANYATPMSSTFGERLAAPFQSGSGFGTELLKPRSMLPMAVGAGQLAEMDAQDQWGREAGDLEAESEAKRRQAYDDLQGAYRSAQPNAAIGLNPYRGQMSQNTPPPMYAGGYAEGGIVGKKPIEPISNRAGLNAHNYVNDNAVPQSAYSGIDPVTIQRGIRGIHSVPPPPGFMPGFMPEFNYFQNDPNNIVAPPITGPADWTQRYAGFPSSRVTPGSSSYFENILQAEKPKGKAAGGDVTLDTPAGQVGVAPGGIANIDNQYTQGPPQPSEQDVQMLAMALSGGVPEADQIIEAFVAKFGPEVFQMIRQMILQSNTPNAQTQGLVQGQGGGMDDQVPGMIGGQQPVAVSPGEYIVPADTVSGLGDGSSEAGARELDAMSDRVRMARGGTTAQPAATSAQNLMPL